MTGYVEEKGPGKEPKSFVLILNNFTVMDDNRFSGKEGFFSKGYYIKVPRDLMEVLVCKEQPGFQTSRVFGHIFTFANFTDGVMTYKGMCYPCGAGEMISSREAIARKMGIDRSVVSQSVQKMVDLGWLECESLRGRASSFRVNDYCEFMGNAGNLRVNRAGKYPEDDTGYGYLYPEREKREEDEDV